MIEHFNIWLFGQGGYEFLGGFIELIGAIGLIVILIATFVAKF